MPAAPASLLKPAFTPSLAWALDQLRVSGSHKLGRHALASLHSLPAGCGAEEAAAGPAEPRAERHQAAGEAEGPAVGGHLMGSRIMTAFEAEPADAAPAWPPRKPLVQWAAQLESYGGGSRFSPHHVGSHPPKPCLRALERRATFPAPLEPAADQLEQLGGPVPKSAVVGHPRGPAASVVGVKRSRMAAFR